MIILTARSRVEDRVQGLDSGADDYLVKPFSFLELPPAEVAEQQQESVVVALQQTEKVIGMIQLMREYLDAEQPGPQACSRRPRPCGV